MPQTLSLNLVHVVFSTKGRAALISEEIAAAMHTYLAETARKLDCECFRAGGVQDHVHLALRLASTRAAAKVVSELKTASSVWMKEKGVAGFSWQRGFGLFSVGPAHHATRGFQDEFRGFCQKYHVPIDERYVWD